MEGDTVRVALSPPRARTRTAQSGGERTKHDVTPPQRKAHMGNNSLLIHSYMKRTTRNEDLKHTCPTSTLCWYFRAIAPEFVKMAVPLPYGFLFTMSMALNSRIKNTFNLECHCYASRRGDLKCKWRGKREKVKHNSWYL